MMDDLRLDRKKLDELFNILGYKRGSPTRNQASLKLETLQFLQRYESEKHGRKIPPNKRTECVLFPFLSMNSSVRAPTNVPGSQRGQLVMEFNYTLLT